MAHQEEIEEAVYTRGVILEEELANAINEIAHRHRLSEHEVLRKCLIAGINHFPNHSDDTTD